MTKSVAAHYRWILAEAERHGDQHAQKLPKKNRKMEKLEFMVGFLAAQVAAFKHDQRKRFSR